MNPDDILKDFATEMKNTTEKKRASDLVAEFREIEQAFIRSFSNVTEDHIKKGTATHKLAAGQTAAACNVFLSTVLNHVRAHKFLAAVNLEGKDPLAEQFVGVLSKTIKEAIALLKTLTEGETKK